MSFDVTEETKFSKIVFKTSPLVWSGEFYIKKGKGGLKDLYFVVGTAQIDAGEGEVQEKQVCFFRHDVSKLIV